MKRALYILLILPMLLAPMELEYNQKMAELVASYNKPLASSPAVIQCFQDSHNSGVVTKKRLFMHLCVQAACDKNFIVSNFANLITDINQQEDNPHVRTSKVQTFVSLLHFIPWNGQTDTKCSFTYHEVLLNREFANLGFSTHKSKIYIFANNEDDFDSEMEHRQKIEYEFKNLLKD